MRRIAFSLVVVVLGAAPFVSAVAGQTTSRDAVVFGYGSRVNPPFVFARSERGTVHLNGILFYPKPGPRSTWRPEAVELPDSVASAWEAKRLAHRQTVRERLQGAKTKGEALRRIRDVYLGRADVDTAWVAIHTVMVQWSEGPLVEYIYPRSVEEMITGVASRAERDDRRIGTTHEEVATKMISQFHEVVETGGIYVFGNGYRLSRRYQTDAYLRELLLSGRIRSLADFCAFRDEHGEGDSLTYLAEDLLCPGERTDCISRSEPCDAPTN